MIITDSLWLYERACQEAKGYSQVQRSNNVGYGIQNNYGVGYNNVYADLELYFVKIICAMFYELITKRCSSLLSKLCSLNNIQIELANVKIDYKQNISNQQGVYDVMPLLEGLNVAFSENLDGCSSVYSKYMNDVFQGRVFNKEFNYITWIGNTLQKLDDNMGRILSTEAPQNDFKLKRTEGSKSPQKAKEPDTVLRIHDPKLSDKLNKFAEERRASDAIISRQIQQLQVLLQDELKQIMEIREGIDYNITQEAIRQFLVLYSLISETLQYHPNEKNKESYYDLIESCEDFLENIKQSLAMLGVAIINDVGKPFDPERHKTVKGIQPTRMATISNVVKIGFIYKNKVLEKAEVELA